MWGGFEVVFLEVFESFVFGGEVAGEVEGGGGLGAGLEHCDIDGTWVLVEYGHVDGFKIGVVVGYGVPRDGGIDTAERDIFDDVVDGGFGDGDIFFDRG